MTATIDRNDARVTTTMPKCRCADKPCVCVINGGAAVTVSQNEGSERRPKLVGLVADPYSALPVAVGPAGVRVSLPCDAVRACLPPGAGMYWATDRLHLRRSTTAGNLLSFVNGDVYAPPVDRTDVDRGTRWFTGATTPPVTVPESRAGDVYIDQGGAVFQLGTDGTWTFLFDLRYPDPSWWWGRLAADQPLALTSQPLTFTAANSAGTWDTIDAIVPATSGWYEISASVTIQMPTDPLQQGTWAAIAIARDPAGAAPATNMVDTVVPTDAPQKWVTASIKHVMPLGLNLAGFKVTAASDGPGNRVRAGSPTSMSRVALRYLAPA